MRMGLLIGWLGRAWTTPLTLPVHVLLGILAAEAPHVAALAVHTRGLVRAPDVPAGAALAEWERQANQRWRQVR